MGEIYACSSVYISAKLNSSGLQPFLGLLDQLQFFG